MSEKILFVDDDENLLASYQRQLRNKFPLAIASGGDHGLRLIASEGPFAVIVSDFRMPGMDGVQFLAKAREAAPDTVRILLTGYADLQTAVEAVNRGNIFRLLNKPCPLEILTESLAGGVRQYQLITAEREFLEKTLKGTIQVLGNVLSMLNPEAFGRTARITRYVREIAAKMGEADLWLLETAATLSQIGCLILPADTLKKIYRGMKLTAQEEELFQTTLLWPPIGSGRSPGWRGWRRSFLFRRRTSTAPAFPPLPAGEREFPWGRGS